jgi:alkylation response protein AidB-like acyl-CoA dehydrogenase
VVADPFRVRTAVHPVTEDGEPVADEWILSGTKDLVFLAGTADVVLVVARGVPKGDARGTDVYAIPTDRQGVTWGGDDSKLGLRGLPTAPLYLVRVPVQELDRVGGEGAASDVSRRAGQLLSIATAACAVGLTRAAVDACISFATERVQFGNPIARYEAIQHAVANQRVGCDAARAMVLKAAGVFDRDGEAPLEAEEANIHAFDLARQSTRTAIRVHGGAGFMRDLPVERYARDVRTLEVLGRAPDVSRSLVGIHNLQVEQGT